MVYERDGLSIATTPHGGKWVTLVLRAGVKLARYEWRNPAQAVREHCAKVRFWAESEVVA